MIDLDTSTLDELQAEFASLAVQYDDVSSQRTLIWAEIESRQKDASVVEAFTALSEKQQDAVISVVSAKRAPLRLAKGIA